MNNKNFTTYIDENESDFFNFIMHKASIGTWVRNNVDDLARLDQPMIDLWGMQDSWVAGTWISFTKKMLPMISGLSEIHLNKLTSIFNGKDQDDLFTIEHEIIRPDGLTRVTEVRIEVHTRNEDGMPLAITGVNIDVTKVKEQEKELIKAKLLAEQANIAKSNFLANMSHELRTPMHGILSFASMGIKNFDEITDENKLKYFGYIKTCGDRLMVLLDNLLDLAKLESGKMEMNYILSSLKEVTQSCITEQQARLDENQQQWGYISGENNDGKGEFDPILIAQVITNLLSNAIKYTPKGYSIEFSIIPTKFNLGKYHNIQALQFSVRDYGKGIIEGEHELVFNKFEQGSSSKPGITKGTGLGLPISKEIIDLHHGKIWAENHPDGGAVFSFIIPIEQPEKEE